MKYLYLKTGRFIKNDSKIFFIKIETFFSTLLRYTYNMSYPTFVLSDVCPSPTFVLSDVCNSYVCLIRRLSYPTFVNPTFVLVPHTGDTTLSASNKGEILLHLSKVLETKTILDFKRLSMI